MSTKDSLKKSLDASFVDTKGEDTHADDKERVDLCCRTLLKCDARAGFELNISNERNIRHCECENIFEKCLKNLNTSLSSETALVYAANAKKCIYTKKHTLDHHGNPLTTNGEKIL